MIIRIKDSTVKMKLSIFIFIVSCLFMVTFGAECDMDYCEKHIRGSSLKETFPY